MDYIKLKIYTKAESADLLISGLSDLGITGFEINDPADFADFIANKTSAWDYIEDGLAETKKDSYVTIYIPQTDTARLLPQVESLLSDLRGDPLYGSLRTVPENVKEEDWAENWKQYYKPFRMGRFIIKPTWEKLPDGFTSEHVVLEIDPTGSFGTGQHETTQMCLIELGRHIKPGMKVLDIGCGSGILSLGAMLLGAESVTSVDVFENCAATTRENLEKAGFDSSGVYCGNIIEDTALRKKIGGGFNLITANIVADVLIAMSEIFYGILQDDGVLIMSGIITARAGEVIQAAERAGFKVAASRETDDWLCLVLCNKNSCLKCSPVIQWSIAT